VQGRIHPPWTFHDRPLKTISGMEFATATWSEWWNTTRLHSTPGHVPPAEAGNAYYAAITAS
jgi:putative transposase